MFLTALVLFYFTGADGFNGDGCCSLGLQWIVDRRGN